jgi:pimeloyl-ACP methyl ester carboxylesterase
METMTITNKKVEYLQTTHVDRVPEVPTSYPPIIKLVQLGFQTLGRLFPQRAAKIAFELFSTPRIRARHKTSDPILESARMFEFMYGKQILKGYEWGNGVQTILLVHGWESRGTALRTFVPALVECGYRVVAFDGPAHGNSDGKSTNLIHFAGAVRAAIRQTGNVHGIIAHSFGGASTVYGLAHLEPEIELTKLVLIATPDSMKKVLEDTTRTLRLPKSVEKAFFKMVENRLKKALSAADVSRAGGKINVKETLLLHDLLDPVVPFATSENIYKHWENATLVVSEGYGHYRLMKNPDLIKRVATFLQV